MRGASKRPVGDVGGRQARLEPHFEVSENRRDASSSDGKGLRGDSRAREGVARGCAASNAVIVAFLKRQTADLIRRGFLGTNACEA